MEKLKQLKIFKNKKAMDFFMVLLLGVVILLLFTMAITLITAKSKLKDIGKIQSDIINVYNEGEGILTYIDKSAYYSLQQALYETLKSGGFYNIELLEPGIVTTQSARCGSYKGNSLWYNKKQCYPRAVKNTLIQKMDDNLAGYISELPIGFISKLEFDYKVSQGTVTSIVAQSKNPLNLNIPFEETEINFRLPEPTGDLHKRIVETAMLFAGTPYVFGGSSPPTEIKNGVPTPIKQCTLKWSECWTCLLKSCNKDCKTTGGCRQCIGATPYQSSAYIAIENLVGGACKNKCKFRETPNFLYVAKYEMNEDTGALDYTLAGQRITSAWNCGFDCSGLVGHAVRQVTGLPLTKPDAGGLARLSLNQYKSCVGIKQKSNDYDCNYVPLDYGKANDKKHLEERLRVGDIVFFCSDTSQGPAKPGERKQLEISCKCKPSRGSPSKPARIGHVGLYVGDGKVLESVFSGVGVYDHTGERARPICGAIRITEK